MMNGLDLRPEKVISLDACRPASPGGLPHRPSGYDIRLVRTLYQHGAANRLVRRMYAWRGYGIQQKTGFRDDPNRATLAVWQDDEVVATLTIRRDSLDGLMADGLYSRELDGLRHPGRVVCEVTRLAVHPDYSSCSMRSALFRAAIAHGRECFLASDVVIEVNPRHVPFYQSLFGFRQIGRQRLCRRVNAPAVLLHQTLETLAVIKEFRQNSVHAIHGGCLTDAPLARAS